MMSVNLASPNNVRNTTATPTPDNVARDAFDPIVTEHQRRLAEIVIDLTLSFAVSLVGIFTNLITMAVYTKQGFKDSVSVSMTAIAFWDFLKCLSGAAQRLSGPIGLADPALALSWTNFGIVLFVYWISIITYITSAMAAYVSVERCLYVCIPFKVKAVLTPRLTLAASVVISVAMFGIFAVTYSFYDIRWRYDPAYNATVAVYEFTSFAQNNTVVFQYYDFSGFIWPTLCLVIIVTSTVIISYKLQQVSGFRQAVTSGYDRHVPSQSNQNSSTRNTTAVPSPTTSAISAVISRRDRKVIKMLLVIIAIFILNLSPRAIMYLVKFFIYDFYFLRKYHILFSTVAYIIFFFDMLNGACNLFVFLAMSSTFRTTFMVMFHLRSQSSRHRVTHSSDF